MEPIASQGIFISAPYSPPPRCSPYSTPPSAPPFAPPSLSLFFVFFRAVAFHLRPNHTVSSISLLQHPRAPSLRTSRSRLLALPAQFGLLSAHRLLLSLPLAAHQPSSLAAVRPSRRNISVVFVLVVSWLFRVHLSSAAPSSGLVLRPDTDAGSRSFSPQPRAQTH